MSGERFGCRNEHRLQVLKDSTLAGTPNAIEYVEVRDSDEPTSALRQRTLFVRTARELPAPGSANEVRAANVTITGGDRVPVVAVEWARRADDPAVDAALVADLDEPDHVLVVRTEDRGDFSTYTLALVVAGTADPLTGFDPELGTVALRFKVECPTDLDCAEPACPPEPAAPGPRIDYLAKDYTGFRRVLLERLALLSPSWSERSSADIGITLVELLAYAADELSWRQDAVATEAYLGTARSRVSLRRHARLVDYQVHEGCSARVLVQVVLTNEATGPVELPASTPVFTELPGVAPVVVQGGADHRAAVQRHPEVFLTCEDATLYPDTAQIRLYGWGDPTACLPRGATTATLRGRPALEKGDLLILAETADPESGDPDAADRTHRYAVRLTDVTPDVDPAGGLFEEPPSTDSTTVTRITWHAEDALPAALPLFHGELGTEVAAAWGNLVLADHGGEGEEETLAPDGRLEKAPLAYVVPVPGQEVSARATLTAQDPRTALAAITLTGPSSEPWEPIEHLLGSSATDHLFVVEREHDRTARLRFGDGRLGARPVEGTVFHASYRLGGGAAGNVGAGSIAHLAVDRTQLELFGSVGNPLPATGGTEPETADEVRRDAPQAFRVQQRAVTPTDYSDRARRSGLVHSAETRFRWTGSWHTVFVTADRPGGEAVDPAFRTSLRDALEKYRMAGYDLEVDGPVDVPLEIDALVCVAPHVLRTDVAAAAREVLLALFHPDRLTFGTPVHLSAVYAALHAIEGVESVTVETFQRLGQPLTSGLDSAVLPMQQREIARLDSDPNFPERGQLTIRTGGGR